jgi:hypothetical protein
VRFRVAALLMLCGQQAAIGQEVTIDAGMSRLRIADSIDATALSVSPALRLYTPTGSLAAYGSFARLAGAWSNSGSVRGALRTPVRKRLSGELEANAGGSWHGDGARTGQYLGSARLHMSRASAGAWAGAGLGRTWDGAWRNVLQGEVGGWLVRSGTAVSASITPTSVDDTIQFADASFTLQRQAGQWDTFASVSGRAGEVPPGLPSNRSVWGTVGAVYWMTPMLGAMASAGTYPVDFTQGFPGGRYVSLSIRLRPRPTAIAALAGRSDGMLEVQRVSAATRRVRVFARDARTVEIMGDFTRWNAVKLVAEGNGWWSAVLPLSAGAHEVNVRIDGGGWRVPPGLAAMRDEFGGSTGLLVVDR